MVKFDEVDKCFKIAFRVEACYNKKADNNGYYVINYLYQVSDLIPPSFFVVVGKPTSILNEGGFFFYS
jgi:hypothetical protein